ncbi:MAG: rubredoxin [Gammaproteobacteria bacterium HGW-Gammaproteobacteria-11]|nr:MAG: rubredoxin [Gammaproteobacteria bacterium HGW-Gammaproteobacteria-11]
MSRYLCPECGYEYDEEKGDRHLGYAPDTPWASLPDSFNCPDCAITYKTDFVLQDEP